MLDTLRSNKNSTILSFVVGMIVVVFIFWGSGMEKGQQGSIVARVNGRPITDIEFGKAYGNRLSQLRRFSNQNPSPSEELVIQQQVLDSLIESEVLRQEARRLHFVVADDELQKFILESPNFKDAEGNFDIKGYKRLLRRYPSYEQDLRDQLLLSRLETFVKQAVDVSEADLRAAFDQQNTQINVEYVKFPYSKYAKDLQVTAEERTAYQKDHAADIQARYDRDFDTVYSQPRQVKASHILLKTEAGDDESVKAQARTKMEAILARAKAAPDQFEALAREFSEDPGSTAKGGDLGYFDEKRMDPAFSKVAFSTAKGAVSELVESRFGLHIIKVEDVKEASVIKLEEARDKITDELIKEQKGPELARKAADKLKAAWVSGGTALDEALKADGLTVEETGLQSRTGEALRGLGRAKEAVETAFSLQVGSPAPGEVFTATDALALIRLKERKEADAAQYAEKKEQLRMQTLMQKQEALWKGFVDHLKAASRISQEMEFSAGGES